MKRPRKWAPSNAQGTTRHTAAGGRRKPYVTPESTVLGTVYELMLGGTVGAGDSLPPLNTLPGKGRPPRPGPGGGG